MRREIDRERGASRAAREREGRPLEREGCHVAARAADRLKARPTLRPEEQEIRALRRLDLRYLLHGDEERERRDLTLDDLGRDAVAVRIRLWEGTYPLGVG